MVLGIIGLYGLSVFSINAVEYDASKERNKPIIEQVETYPSSKR